jgi:hypothetical protein
MHRIVLRKDVEVEEGGCVAKRQIYTRESHELVNEDAQKEGKPLIQIHFSLLVRKYNNEKELRRD